MSSQSWSRYDVGSILPKDLAKGMGEPTREIRQLADLINQAPERSAGGEPALPAETLLALRTVNQALRHVARQYFTRDNPGSLERGRQWSEQRLGAEQTEALFKAFVELFPPLAVTLENQEVQDYLTGIREGISGWDQATMEQLLLFLNVSNPAARPAREVFDDDELRRRASYVPFIT